MENTSIYRLATKAFKEISQSEERLFFNAFKDYLKDKKMFFGHFTNLDFYFFFFYCYFMWRAKRVLSFEEVNGLMNNVEMVELIYTSFDEVEETCSGCEGDGEEECPNCDGEKYVECSECDGTGMEGDEECYQCEGTGRLECGICDGDGSLTCEYCDGSGQEVNTSVKGITKHLTFTTDEDEKDMVFKSYENSEKLNEDVANKLNYLANPFDSQISLMDTMNLEEFEYYVDNIITNPEKIGWLIRNLYYLDQSPLYIYER